MKRLAILLLVGSCALTAACVGDDSRAVMTNPEASASQTEGGSDAAPADGSAVPCVLDNAARIDTCTIN